MPQTVNVPGVGQLQFPDGMSQADMAAAIQKNFPQVHASGSGSAADQIPLAPGAAERMRAEAAARQPEQTDNALGKVFGLVEPVISMGTGMIGSTIGSIVGAGKSVLGGHFGTQEGVREGEELAGKVADAMTYQPRTATGQELTQKAGKALEDSGIIGVPIPELDALGRALPIARTGGRATKSPVPEVVPAVNYDVPAYVRKGIALPSEVKAAPATAPAAIAAPATPAKATKVPPIKSPLAAPDAALRPVEPAPMADVAPTAPAVAESAPAVQVDATVKAPEPVAARLTESLRDTSDIDGMLKQFGVEAPEPIPAPVSLRTDPVERAAGPIAPIDDAVRVPADAVPPAPKASPVERANGPAAPLDENLRAPTSFGKTEPEQPFVATPERHVDPAQRSQHLQVLRDIGLENIRESAINGDAATAAREFQNGRITSEPAGKFWFDQFQRETEAMKNYAQRLMDDTRGRKGLDSDSLEQKGRELAAPYDAARSYFEKAKQNLYDIADKENGGTALKSTEHIDNLLVDREFNNTALADKTLDLVEAVKRQFDLHKERNGGALTVKEAESFRKWLNKRWTPENSKIIGAIKDALDEDVFSSAGQDVYAAARQMHQLEKRTLDDPNGISRLMDSDPHAPLNRSTPYEAIPNALVKLSNEQFKHIIETYKNLPPELQPIAQQAIATLKAHYVERMLNIGTETAKGNPRQLWNTGEVQTFVSNNSGKLPLLFDASELARIDTLLKAGDILRVNPAYPGAAAQLANASKAGLMSTLAGKVGAGVGGAAGALVAGPFGAGAGGLAGDAIAGNLSKFAGERKALAEAKKAIISEFRTEPKPRNPVEEWEQGLR